MKNSLVAFACAIGVMSASAMAGVTAYYVDDGGLPWGDVGLTQAMDMNFGGGGWIDANYVGLDVPTMLSAGTSFIYLEGSDGSANALNSFLGANSAALEAWVFAGGKLYMNAAPNQGGNMNFGFGGITLNYSDLGFVGTAVNPAHPIFSGPFGNPGTDFTGNAFAHATVSGAIGTSVIDNENGSSVLAEFGWGSGNVMVGGMTAPVWNQDADGNEIGVMLRANIINHAWNVPGPGALALLGIGGLAARRRRRR